MKNTFLGFLILGMMCCGAANAQYPDELLRADSLIQHQEYGKAINLLNQLIERKPSRFVLSKTYFQLARGYLGIKDFAKAKYFNELSLSIKNDLFYELIADNYMLFGLIEMEKDSNEKALVYFFKGIELPFETIESGGLLYAYIAQVYYRKGEMENVIKYYTIAMKTLQTAFEESTKLDLNHYKIRGNYLFYDNFFVGFL